VNGLPVAAVRQADLRALVSPWSGPAPALGPELARSHAAVVESAYRSGAVLPCPVGTVTPDPALRSWLEEHSVRAAEALLRLAGQAEFALKVWAAEPEPGAAPGATEASAVSGRAYLAALRREAARRRELEAAARQAGERLVLALGVLVTAAEEPEGQGLLYRAELLAPFEAAAQVRDAFAELTAGLPPALGARLSGPWPPYYFAGVMMRGRASPAEWVPAIGAAAPSPSPERIPG
jgi:hypothetical protein